MKTYAAVACAFTLFVLSAAALAPQSSRAAGPWYVAPGGNDGNTCSSAITPCASIDGAISKASAGDTIYVATGMYTGTDRQVVLLNQNVTLSGGWDISFTTHNGTSTIDGDQIRRGIVVEGGRTVAIERFVIQNGFYKDPGYMGGGILNDGGTLTLSTSVIRNNESMDGGGINNRGTMIINNTSIINNSADRYGGGIQNYFGTLTLNSSLVSGNVGFSDSQGAGIYVGGIVTLNNSTVNGNRRGSPTGGGEGIYVGSGNLTINSSTINENDGPGIGTSYGTTLLQNTLLAGNGGFDCYTKLGYQGTVVSQGYNLIQTSSGCALTATDLTNVDPKLTPLQNNGGPTLTQGLLPGSPAINAGNPAGCMSSTGPLTTDQRGLERFDRCDIGAFELQPIEYSTKVVNLSTGLLGTPLTYTLALANGGPNLIANILMTDALPISLTYHIDSLNATGGIYGFNDGIITWTGSLSAGNAVTLTFGATVSEAASLGPIVNTAIISGNGMILNRTATFNVDGYACNLAKYSDNPVLTVGASDAWDDAGIWRPSVLKMGNTYKMWYSASDGTTRRIGYAASSDGIHWTKYGANPVLVPGPSAWDGSGVYAPSVIYDGVYKMWYVGIDSSELGRIGYATSPDGITWTKYGSTPVVYADSPGTWEDAGVAEPTVIKVGSAYHLWYVGNDELTSRIGHATSPNGISWIKDAANPVVDLGSAGSWEWLDVYGPSVVRVGDEYKLWYSGSTLPAAYQIGYATSSDGSTWTRQQKLITQGTTNTFDFYSADYPAVIVDGAGYEIWYSGRNSTGTYNIGYAMTGVCGAMPLTTINSKIYLPLIIKSQSCQAYYSDDFSDPHSGWPISDDSNRRYAYVNGEYQILVKNKNNAWFVTPGAKATDFTVSVSARRMSDTSGAYGILFGVNEYFTQFYEVLVDDNSFSIWRYLSGGWSPLKAWTSSPYIATGTNWNRLKVVRSGANISFYVNGHLLTTLEDNLLMGLRRVGLAAESDATAVDVRFDDFALYPANCGSQVYSVAAFSSFVMGKAEVHQGLLSPRPLQRENLLQNR